MRKSESPSLECRYGRIYIEKVQLIGFDADAVGEKQNIALQPGHVLGREFVTSSGGSHCEYTDVIYKEAAEDKGKCEEGTENRES